MPSPFPDMDSYLEGYLWPDVHHPLRKPDDDSKLPPPPSLTPAEESWLIQEARSVELWTKELSEE